MTEFIICGSMYDSDGLECPIYCDPITGDLVVELGMLGKVVLGNVSVNNPRDMEGVSMNQFYQVYKCIGVAVTEEYILAFREETVDYYKMSDIYTVVHSTPYDTDTEYEGEINVII